MSCNYMRYKVVPCNHYSDMSFYKNHWKMIQFPCGHCSDCTKSRQNDIAVRAGYEAQKYSYISFCRLSYNNESLPLSYVPYIVFADGTKIQDGKCELLTGDFLKGMRIEMAKVPNSVIKGKSRYLHYEVPGFRDVNGYGTTVQYLITPSVNMDDPRLWLKACRVAYKREFGKPLPDFKYLMCAEYGTQYTRPHYHYLFMGLEPRIVDWMLARWEVRYGYTTRKSVVNSPKDKFRVCSYISKYMSKGEFEAPAVTAGVAKKGRYCASRYMGSDVLKGKQAHFLAFDVFGEYDPDTLIYKNGSRMSLAEQKTVVQSIIDRMSVQVPGMDYRFPLPKLWKYMLYYHKVPRRVPKFEVIKSDNDVSVDIKSQNSYRYVSFKIYALVQKTLQDRAITDDLRQLQKFTMSVPPGSSVIETNIRFKDFKKALAKNSEAHSRETLRNFYSKDSQ